MLAGPAEHCWQGEARSASGGHSLHRLRRGALPGPRPGQAAHRRRGRPPGSALREPLRAHLANAARACAGGPRPCRHPPHPRRRRMRCGHRVHGPAAGPRARARGRASEGRRHEGAARGRARRRPRGRCPRLPRLRRVLRALGRQRRGPAQEGGGLPEPSPGSPGHAPPALLARGAIRVAGATVGDRGRRRGSRLPGRAERAHRLRPQPPQGPRPLPQGLRPLLPARVQRGRGLGRGGVFQGLRGAASCGGLRPRA
mmetsp:Transcript_66077/g.132607  ORF Transcript_66077/g.132607 Transcript_66077/m.132607 type:complete len:256 (-) Transcript_66077:185-952(-)